MAFMYKPSGRIYLLDFERQDYTNAFDGATLTQVLQRGEQWFRFSQARELTDTEIELPRSLIKFCGFDQGFHKRLWYGYSDVYQHHRRARTTHCSSSVCLFSAIEQHNPWRLPYCVYQGASHASCVLSALDDRLRRELIFIVCDSAGLCEPRK